MMGVMIYFVINMRFLRFLRFFEKWSELGKIRKNGVKCLSQSPQTYTTQLSKNYFVVHDFLVLYTAKTSYVMYKSELYMFYSLLF